MGPPHHCHPQGATFALALQFAAHISALLPLDTAREHRDGLEVLQDAASERDSSRWVKALAAEGGLQRR